MSEAAIKKITPWVKLVLLIGGMLVSVVVYAFTNFQTQISAEKSESRIEKHMDRLESKVDALILDAGIQQRKEWQKNQDH